MSPEQHQELVTLANALEAAAKTVAGHVLVVDEVLGERHTNDLEELSNTLLLSSHRVRERVGAKLREASRGRR